jgi:hypothetical protein
MGVESERADPNGVDSKRKIIFEIVGIYLFWISIHFIAGNFYSIYCVDFSVYGFLTSPFTAITPHCIAARWIITNGGKFIENMWIYIGTYLSVKITAYYIY